MTATLSEMAAFYWAGIAYEILSPDEAIAWADGLIASGADVPGGVYDLSLTPPTQPKKVVSALRSLHSEREVVEATVRGLLGTLGRRLRTHDIGPAAAIRLAYHVTRRLSVDSPLWREAMILEENYFSAADGLGGKIHELNAEVESWLADFDGDATRFHRRAG